MIELSAQIVYIRRIKMDLLNSRYEVEFSRSTSICLKVMRLTGGLKMNTLIRLLQMVLSDQKVVAVNSVQSTIQFRVGVALTSKLSELLNLLGTYQVRFTLTSIEEESVVLFTIEKSENEHLDKLLK